MKVFSQNKSTRSLQLITLAVAAGLVALLFFNGRQSPSALTTAAEGAPEHGETGFDYFAYAEEAESRLDAPAKAHLDTLKSALKLAPESEAAQQALAQAYDSLGIPAMAGYYYNQMAEKQPENIALWEKMGNAFFDAQQQAMDSPTLSLFAANSIAAYNKVLEKQPGNLDVKANQGWNLHVSGLTMDGVGQLRTVLQANPDHQRSLLYMGFLSMQSGQHDKAIERFQHLIEVAEKNNNREYPFYYRYLGEAYLEAGQPQKAREAFQNYKLLAQTLLQDTRMVEDAERFLNSIP